MEANGGTGANKKATLAIIIISIFISTIMMSAVHVALPTIGKEFAMEAVLLGWVITAMTLPQTAILLAAGRLADIYGRKKIFIYGMFLFTIATFLCSIAHSSGWLIVYRALQGVAAGLAFGTQMAIITSVFPGNERGRALGISAASGFFGLSIGPFLGGVLTQQLGWRSIFYLTGILSVVVITFIFWKMKGEWADARGEKFDVTGSVVFGISIVVAMYGFTLLPGVTGFILVLAGATGLLLFVRLESRTKNPIINLGLFRNNNVFVFSSLATLAHYCAVFAAIVLLSLYLQYTKGFSPQTTGTIMLIQPVFMASFSPVAGRLSDKIEPRKVASVGLTVTFLTFVTLAFVDETTSLGFIIIRLAFFGLGSGLFASPNSNAIMGSVERKFLGVASGTQGTMRSSGQMLGMGIVMIVFSIIIGNVQITPEYYPAFLTSARTGFAIFAAISLIGIFLQYFGGRAKETGLSQEATAPETPLTA
jgi:EmrB/QacA subfamily drug resistance transporter